MNKIPASTIKLISILAAASFSSLLQGCHGTPNRNTQPWAFVPGQDIIINYALDVNTRKYVTGEFVSMNNNWITLSKARPFSPKDQRSWHSTFSLEHVYLIQSAQE